VIRSGLLFYLMFFCALLFWCFLPPTDGAGCFYIDYFLFIDSFLCVFNIISGIRAC